MNEKVRSFFKWSGTNIAWDVLKVLAFYIGKGLFSLLGGEILLQKIPEIATSINGFLSSVGVSAGSYIIALVLVSFLVYGVISFLSPPVRWLITYILRSDKPHLVQGNEWDHVIDYEGKKVVIAMISINNKPGRRTDNSVAFAVSARLDYFDRDDKHVLRVKCGHWTKDAPQAYFFESGKNRRCEKVDFYPHDTWFLPTAYEVTGDDKVYAYDHSSGVRSKKLGKLPIKLTIVFEGENLNPTRPIRYLLIPNTTGQHPRGFWIQKR